MSFMFPVPRLVNWHNYTPTLPNFYWDVYSDEQRIKHLCMEMHKLVDYCDMLGEDINITHSDIEQLQEDFQAFQDGEFIDLYVSRLEAWIEKHFAEIVRKHMGIVWPALDTEGHFVLYSANIMGIKFDTIMTEGADFGRILIKY